jgi:hypothetical protein
MIDYIINTFSGFNIDITSYNNNIELHTVSIIDYDELKYCK